PTRMLLLTVIVLVTLPAAAHHSFAMFDPTHRMTMRGTVKALEWTNPHVWMWVVSEGSADAVPYAFEAPSINELVRLEGWTKHTIRVGDTITVEYFPLKSGNKGGLIVGVTGADGRPLLHGGELKRSDPGKGEPR